MLGSGCFVLVFLIVVLASPTLVSARTRPNATGKCILNNPTLLRNKVMFYSPSIIGEDTHISKIDLYTDYFASLHEAQLKLIRGMGVTHVVVGETWSTDGAASHKNFIQTVKNNNLSLIVSFTLPSGKPDRLEDTDYQALRDNRKKAFVSLMKEFDNSTNPLAVEVAKFIYFPQPIPDKMGKKDIEEFYDMVNILIRIKDEKQPKLRVMVGIAFSPTDGKAPVFDYSMVALNITKDSDATDMWVSNFYTGDKAYYKLVINNYWIKFWPKAPPPRNVIPPFMPMIATDNFDPITLKENMVKQRQRFCEIYNFWSDGAITTQMRLWGMGIWEFSDEWWRSDLATSGVGFDPEGCPNGNPYAHTACGLTNWGSGNMIALEYTGLYKIEDRPFQYCVVPKDIVEDVAFVWGNISNEENVLFDANAEACVFVLFVIHHYAFFPIFAVAILCLVLILLLEPPKPPPIVINDLDSALELHNRV